MRAVRWAAGLWLWAVLAAATGATAADGDLVPVPPLRAHVTDLTGTLSGADKGALEQKLAGWEAQKGGQFAVLLVPTTKPESIDQYSQRVTDAWKLGRKGVDDGVLLLIAKDDKKLRFQVGKGFEGALTDVTAKRIIEEVIVPVFRQGNFAAGINAGIDKVIGVVAGEALPPPPARPAQTTTSSSRSNGWPMSDWLGFAIFAGLGLFWASASFLNRVFGRVGGSLVGGVAAGAIGWFLTSLLVIGIAAGVIGFIFMLIALAARGAGGGFGPGGFGSYGGGGFSGGSGGSSWSGGGGDFGGGGASGSWGGGDSGGGDSGGGGGGDS
jgi:uncharacterized protein